MLRFWKRHTAKSPENEPLWAEKEKRGYDALGVMEQTLEKGDWLLGAAPSIADISLYAYTHVADQGGFDLARFPAVSSWIERFPGLPGFQPFAGRLKETDDRKVRAPS